MKNICYCLLVSKIVLCYQEISEDVTSVEHKWLDGGVPYIEERNTPDIENMDLEQYQQSIAQ